MIGSWHSTSINLITVSFFFTFVFYFGDVYAVPTKHLCPPQQRDALLEIKKELDKSCFYPANSWDNNSNFCLWEGITCDAKSEKVIELSLSYGCLNGQIPSSIGNLSHLTFLVLSGNNFVGEIPSSFGNLKKLTTLYVSSNKLSGNFPIGLLNLTNLSILDVSYNELSGNLPIGLLNLKNLSILDVSYNKFSGNLPIGLLNLTNLSILDVSYNQFTGTIPSSLFTTPSLLDIDLSDNQFSGTLEFGNISSPSKLRSLDVSNNNFRGPIPTSISKLVNLTKLDLSHWNTQGPVDFSIFSHIKSLHTLYLSHLNTTTTIELNAILSYFKELSNLDISGNHVSATNSISDPPSNLTYLDLSNCGITEFPESIRTLPMILFLYLSNNRIKGQVPSWLWSLPNLYTVDLSNNNFSGFNRSTKDFARGGFEGWIGTLDLRSNDFQGPFFVPPRPITYLLASRNNFSGEIPKSICGMTSLVALDLSSNNLNGSIPQCLENLIESFLEFLILSDNHLSGILPEIFLNCHGLLSLNVGHNNLVGKIPRSLSACPSLGVLNLEHNRINDTFPFWLQPLEQLRVLVLRSNGFHGSLHPRNISSGFLRLQIIDVSQNDFMGTLPSDFFMYLSMLSEGVSREPHMVGDDDKYLDYNIFYNNSLALMNKGVEAKMEGILTLLTAIDLSGNKLSGKIPESIGALKGLIVLNLSNNHFEGHIPTTIANLTELESLDLSRNMLSGKIPIQLGKLTFMEIVDFSHNKLVGMIPGNTQFQTQDPSRFQDNVGLCGPPLKKCGVVHDPPPSQEPEEEEEILSWTAAAIGVGPGIVLGLSIGYVMMSYKPHWFFKVFELVSLILRCANKKPKSGDSRCSRR